MKLANLKQNRRFLLVLPILVLPFLCFFFYSLGGGTGNSSAPGKKTLGLNTQLPAPAIDPAKAFENKLKAYHLADNDSIRKAQFAHQDPYRRDTPATFTVPPSPAVPPGPAYLPPPATPSHPSGPNKVPSADNRAAQLLQQLAALRQSLHQSPQPLQRPAPLIPSSEPPGNPNTDPQLDRINILLDKVLRIQHPLDQQPHPAQPSAPAVDHIGPADTTANSLSANIPEDQLLTNGATIALRITDSIRINGSSLPPGRLVFGTTTFNNDRLLVHINSLREGSNLYTVDWQVVDLDGLPGIHMPALLGRDVAKQSADQGIGSLNLLTTDPTLGAQAAGAGIQAAKSFLSHKVRQVRVTVRAGYQLLLRSAHEQIHQQRPPARTTPALLPQPPDFVPDGPPLAKAREGGVECILRDIRIRDSCLWFGLVWINRSPIDYSPAYLRWCIRSRDGMNRTAVQEQTLDPVTTMPLPVVSADSIRYGWVAFRPFALSKGKQLFLLVGTRSGDRTLTIKIQPHQLLKAKTDVTIPK